MESVATDASNEMCRACMNKSYLVVDLFNTVEKDVASENKTTFADMFRVICAPIQVSRDDGLPLKLCYRCTAALKNAFEFRNKCQKIDSTFRTAFISCTSYSPNTEDNEYMSVHIKKEIDDKSSINLEVLPEDVNTKTNPNQTPKLVARYVCMQCTKEYLTSISLKNHLKSVHNLTFHCKVTKCKRSFLNNDQLLRHQRLHEKDTGFFKCTQCTKTFSHCYILRRHMMVAHSLELSSAAVKNGKEGVNNSQDTDNILSTTVIASKSTEENKEISTNTVDDKSFLYKILSSEPTVIEKNDEKYPKVRYLCLQCKHEYQTALLLKKHLKTAHKLSFKCKKCRKSFLNNDQLMRHNVIHDERKSIFKCSRCPKTFTRGYLLQQHMATVHLRVCTAHKYRCKKCSVEFKWKTSLVQHNRKVHKKKTTVKNAQAHLSESRVSS